MHQPSSLGLQVVCERSRRVTTVHERSQQFMRMTRIVILKATKPLQTNSKQNSSLALGTGTSFIIIIICYMSLLYKGLESSNHLIQVIDIKQTCKPEKECVYNMNVSGRDFFILCGFVIHMSIPILQVSLLVMPKLGILTFCPHLRLDVWYVAFVDI